MNDEYTGYEKYTNYGENQFVLTSEKNTSTFAVDAEGASYANMRRFVNLAQVPPTASVRIEEYLNYFQFDYAEPAGEEVAIDAELSECPWTSGNLLLRIGLKGRTIPEDAQPASNFVFLIDVSGSMASPDKLELLKAGFKTMLTGMKSSDKLAIVTYSNSTKILLDLTSIEEKDKIINAINQLEAGGSTAGAAGLELAYQIALENFIEGGNNRVIIGTDGDFNVGPSSTEELIDLIEEKRKTGIFLSVLGVGDGNLNDGMMEQVADHGNGNYEYIDCANQLKKVFIYDYLKFYTVAKDCKVQLSFDSTQVYSYRLIGYENRSLADSSFANDTVDAGEIGSTQTVTALYELVPATGIIPGSIARIDFRYKRPLEETSRLITREIGNTIVPFSESTENTRFAASVAAFGMWMKKSEYKGSVSKQNILDWATGARSFDPNLFRQEFISIAGNAL
jgi:Ca-activated chloride channel family protein